MQRSFFVILGNFVPYITKPSGRMRTRAKLKFAASDRARRRNVLRTFFIHLSAQSGFAQGDVRGRQDRCARDSDTPDMHDGGG